VLLFAAAAAMSAACKPNIVGRSSVVDSDRVLVVRSEPPEVDPKAPPPTPGPNDPNNPTADGGNPAPDGGAGPILVGVRYSALYVGPKGAADASRLEWAFCETQKPLDVTGPISPACLVPSATVLGLVQVGETMTAPVPDDACSVFGPLAPPVKQGEPAGRPADPDTTGGYYQPVRLLIPAKGEPDYAVGVTRLDCGLAGATQEQAGDYAKRHRPNENPSIDSLELTRANGKREVLAPAASLDVARGETITLKANWASCPATDPPTGCTGAEPYVALDPVAHTLVDRRESMRVSWFGTAGDYAHERTGRTEQDTATSSENEWTAPDAQGPVFLWVVLRDDRGGAGFARDAQGVGQAYEINVQP
jgi:hypothetical protein